MSARRFYESAQQVDKAAKATKVPAIARAAAVIRLLGRSTTPLGVHPIARELGLMPSTCLYTLRALVAENFVSFDDTTKLYTLDSGLLAFGRNWHSQNSFSELAQPHLDRLASEWPVVAFGIHIVRSENMIVVAASRSWNAHLSHAPIGSRMPGWYGATGRCVAAFGDYSEEVLKERFKDLSWAAPLTYAQWKTQVDETRTRGFSVDVGCHMAGVTFIAAPIFDDSGQLSYSIVVSGKNTALQQDCLATLEKAVVSAARIVTGQLQKPGTEADPETDPKDTGSIDQAAISIDRLRAFRQF